MKLADVITASDVTQEGLQLLRSNWLPFVKTEAPHKLLAAIDLAVDRLNAIAAGNDKDAQDATVAINLLLENIEANAAYRLQATLADGALFVLRAGAGALLKFVVPL